MTEFNESSYDKHAKHYSSTSEEEMQNWTRTDNVDYWRHKRMYDTLLPILNNYKDDKWLTIGDGRYGTDAHYISQYSKNVIATDICEDCLKIAKEKGFISDYKIENAEKMSFQNNEFDFALVKESYHHFPRPTIAVYEMLRVAKKGIILIEPNDENNLIPHKQSIGSAFFWFKQAIKNSIKKILGKDIYYLQGNYEDSGNYVFNISEREIEKIALGLNYDMVAFKGINDAYIEGVEKELIDDNGILFNQIKKAIEREDNLVKKGHRKFGLLTAIIFKEMPNENCISDMKKMGYEITKLTKNPYL